MPNPEHQNTANTSKEVEIPHLKPVVAGVLGGVNFGGLFGVALAVIDIAVEHDHHLEQRLMHVTKLTQALVR